MKKEVKSKDELIVKISESVGVKMKKRFSIIHLYSAALFARKSHEIEKQWQGVHNPTLYREDLAYVSSSIISSVAFLESTINEIYSDSLDQKPEQHPILSQLDSDSLNKIIHIQNVLNLKFLSILEKYQFFLILLNKAEFDKGKNPYQDTNVLIKLRNDLVHYNPEWIDANDEPTENKPHRYESALIGRFEENLFMKSSGNPFYPYKCLGYGCADWAVTTAKNFVAKFSDDLGGKMWFDLHDVSFNTK